MRIEDARQQRYWDRRVGGRMPDHPVVRVFVRQRLEALQRIIAFPETKRFLDVGTGAGWPLASFHELVPQVVGLDRSFALLREGAFSVHPLVQGDLYHLPFKDRSFDIVSCWEVLHHVAQIETSIREMARVSRRYLVLFEPNRYHPLQFLFGVLVKEERGTLRSHLPFLKGLLEQAGLRVIHASQAGTIFPNKLPTLLLPLFRRLPFQSPFGISCMLVAQKSS